MRRGRGQVCIRVVLGLEWEAAQPGPWGATRPSPCPSPSPSLPAQTVQLEGGGWGRALCLGRKQARGGSLFQKQQRFDSFK